MKQIKRYITANCNTLPLIRPLPPKATLFIMPDFRSTEMVKYFLIVPLKRGTTFSLQ
jgi:hypothetical protein